MSANFVKCQLFLEISSNAKLHHFYAAPFFYNERRICITSILKLPIFTSDSVQINSCKCEWKSFNCLILFVFLLTTHSQKYLSLAHKILLIITEQKAV
jgi:hypothetical protein